MERTLYREGDLALTEEDGALILTPLPASNG